MNIITIISKTNKQNVYKVHKRVQNIINTYIQQKYRINTTFGEEVFLNNDFDESVKNIVLKCKFKKISDEDIYIYYTIEPIECTIALYFI